MFSYEQFADQLENTNHWIDGQWIDYSTGLILGHKVGLHWGFFVEGEYMKYWDRRLYSVKCGLNYQFR